jgi:hypothetical protein
LDHFPKVWERLLFNVRPVFDNFPVTIRLKQFIQPSTLSDCSKKKSDRPRPVPDTFPEKQTAEK